MTVFSSSLWFLVLLTFTMSDERGLISFNKVHLDLYYESLCPDCSSFIQSQLKPTWERLHRSKIMSISLYPFGNAKEHELANGTFTYTCQHAEEECFGNFVEACILKLKQFDADQYMPMIACIEEGVQTGKSIKNVVQSCLRMHLNEKSQSWVMECATGQEGQRLMHKMATKTKSLVPQHTFVPWIVVNGKYSTRHQREAEADLTKLICKLYKGQPPLECS